MEGQAAEKQVCVIITEMQRKLSDLQDQLEPLWMVTPSTRPFIGISCLPRSLYYLGYMVDCSTASQNSQGCISHSKLRKHYSLLGPKQAT